MHNLKIPVPPLIQWHEGMMLQPHHFQQHDQYYQRLWHYHLTNLIPYYYGVKNLVMDGIALPSGLIRINEFDGVFPDGTVVQTDFGQTIQESDVTDLKDKALAGSVPVFLCIAQNIDKLSPVVGEFPRYSSSAQTNVIDINTNDNPIDIPSLRPVVRVIAGDLPPHPYASILIAKVRYVDGSFIREEYTPPALSLSKESLLGQRISRIAGQIREKAYFFAEKLQTQVGSPLLQETSQLLRPLLTVLPGLEAILYADGIHPFQYFLKVCDVLGSLSGFRLRDINAVTKPYNHNDIDQSFAPILDSIEMILLSMRRSFSVESFNLDDGRFSIHLNPAFVDHENYVWIGVKTQSGMTESELGSWMDDAVIASETLLEKILIKRISGAKRILQTDQSVLSELLLARGVLAYKVIVDDEFVRTGQKLYVFNPADVPGKRPADVVLYVKQDMSGDALT